MSLSVQIRCPQCSAEGELADAALFGQAISCPLCQHVFVAPVPDGFVVPVPTTLANAPSPDSLTAIPVESMPGCPATAVETLIPAAIVVDSPLSEQPMASATVPVEAIQAEITTPSVAEAVANVVAEADVPSSVMATPVEPSASAPAVADAVVAPFIPTPRAATSVSGDFLVPERPPMEGPVPSFMAPSSLHGPAEIAFAQSLPEPAARGSVKGPKPQNKTLQLVVAGGISAILLFALVMFLMGDPLRGKKPKLGPMADAKSTASSRGDKDESIEDVFKRIQSSSKSDND